jgi:hypothetical protein
VNELNSKQNNNDQRSTSASYKAVLNQNDRSHSKLKSPPPKEQQNSNYTSSDNTDAQLATLVQSLSVHNDENTPSKEANNNNNNSLTKQHQDYHWLVYKQEDTPSRIIEAKKRLGQIKEPNVAPQASNNKRYVSASSITSSAANQPSSYLSSSDSCASPTNGGNHAANIHNNKNWMQWDNPGTPENVKNIRYRLGDDRYKKLSDRLVRCKTAHLPTSYEEYEQAKARPKTGQQQKQNNNNDNNVNTVTFINNELYNIPTAYETCKKDNILHYENQSADNSNSNDIVVLNPENVALNATENNLDNHNNGNSYPSVTVQDDSTIEQPLETWAQSVPNDGKF